MSAVAEKPVDREGLPVTCTNLDALPVYNEMLLVNMAVRESALSQVQSVLELDQGFILAHCILGCMWLSELIPATDPKVSGHVKMAKTALEGGTLTEREERHVQALLAYAEGQLPTSIDHWAAILVNYPRDLIAVRILFVSCIMVGNFEKMRNVLAGVLPRWDEDMPSYPFILGFFAFGLEQTNYKDRAEDVARKGLDMEKRNPWATHTLSHVIEEARPVQSGVELLTQTRENWLDSLIGSHINWHLALYYYELGDTEAVLNEYDTILVKSVTPDNRLGLLDASSLLWRLNLMGVDVGNRWQRITDSLRIHIGKHGSSWYDAHLMFSLCHGRLCEETARLALAREMVKSVEEYAKNGGSYDSSVSEMVGVPCCNALLAYGEEKYDEVVSLLVPLRYDLHRLGGSWAQRQVFNLTMIQAAVNARDIPMAMALVAELKAQKPQCRSLSSLFNSLKTTYDAKNTTPTDHTPSSPARKKPRTEQDNS